MESANLHHKHQLQEQLIGSSSFANPSFYGVGNTHTWTPNLILNASISNPNVNGVFSNSRDLRQNNYIHVPPSLNTSMIQDLGYHWASNVGSFSNHSANELQLIAKIKEENSDSFPKFSEMINSPSNVEEFHLPTTSYIKHEQQELHDLSEKLLLKTISSGCQISGLQLSSGGLYSNSPISYASFGGVATPSRGNFSQIFPSIHISNPNASSSSFSSSLGMNLQALDLLNSTKFGGSFSHPSNNDLGLFKESPSFNLDHMQESSTRPSNSQNKMSSFTNGVTETKRPSSISELKASHGAPKKPRLESRSPFPPFKVRKEKLGDRIVALQQLVAPFGKTDTASVLMEAIGYIKFLQDQVETLSVPYMKSARNCSRQMQGGSIEDNRNEEPKPDLRSRGLCLVPISCTSYVTNDNGGVWPHPNFS